MEKYRITLTPEEGTGLEHLVSVGQSAARKLTHARILLLVDELHGSRTVHLAVKGDSPLNRLSQSLPSARLAAQRPAASA